MREREIERILKALANKRRLQILKILYKDKEKSVGDIAEAIKLSFRSTSKHLSVLINADILEKEQNSSRIFYSIDKSAPDLIKQLLKILLSV